MQFDELLVSLDIPRLRIMLVFQWQIYVANAILGHYSIFGTHFIYRTRVRIALNVAAPQTESVEKSVPALDRALDVFECLSAARQGMTLTELTDQLGVPKNSIFRITQTLLARGYLTRDAQTMAFRLTPRLLRLAPPRWGGIGLPEAARTSMIALRDATEETVQLGVLSDSEGVIIDQVEGTQPLRIVVDLGLRFSLHNNAPGKLLLAFMPPPEQRKLLSSMKLSATTSRTITDKGKLTEECERIVARGYSTDHAEADEGVHCVAAPIFGPDEVVVGTVWVSGPAKRIPKSRFKQLGEEVRDAGRQISGVIGEYA